MIDENVTEAQQKKLETDIAALARSDPSRFLTLDAAINLEVLDGATRLEATARVKEGEADETVWTVKLVSRGESSAFAPVTGFATLMPVVRFAALLDDAMYGGYYTALHGLDNPLATHKMWDAERLERYHLLVHQKQDGKGGLVPTKVEHPKIAVWTVSFGEDTHGYLKKLHRDWALAQAVVKVSSECRASTTAVANEAFTFQFISVPSFRQGLHLSSIAKNVCKHGMGSVRTCGACDKACWQKLTSTTHSSGHLLSTQRLQSSSPWPTTNPPPLTSSPTPTSPTSTRTNH